MSKKIFLILAPAFVIPLSCAQAQPTTQPSTLTFDAPQTAGISGLRPLWDTPVVLSENGAVEEVDKGQNFGKAISAVWLPEKRGDKTGALVFDAVHRSLLVRFPGSTTKIAAQLKTGKSIQKVELILPFKSTELWPEGYADPAGMSFIGDQWAKSVPRWHAVAWALRKPWTADPQIGPTFNANINSASYWGKYGARDEKQDRFSTRFGRAEVSAEKTEPLDVTALLTDAEFGATIEDRLRKLEYTGFLVQKEETYDASDFRGSYEWTTARGGQGILVATPRLKVTFVPGKAAKIDEKKLDFDFDAFVTRLKTNKNGGAPTAVVPNEAEFEKLKARLGFVRPIWMTADWQWKRVQELVALQKKSGQQVSEFPQTYDEYLKWLDEQLARPPRSWRGFDAAEVAQNYFKNADAMPAPVKDHWKLYWSTWLMPDRDYAGFDYDGKTYSFAQGYVGGKEMEEYQKATGDWRGNSSVYRTYLRDMGTMNFNHWAVTGGLLGGAIIGDENMMAQGRDGLERFPLKLWSWYDGSTQESIDHYYFAESLTAQKVFADYGPTPADRMMGESILTKGVEELASSYHPNLRRMVSSSGRTGIAYVLGIQDGLQHILHTLSPSGAETDMNVKEVTAPNLEQLNPIGQNFDPGMAAQQTLNGPWAPEWFSNIVDEKPLPYGFTNSYKQWGSYNASPLWKRGYMGENYGMASVDVASSENVPFLVQWRRDAEQADSMTDLGTLLVRGGANRTEMLDSIYHGSQTRNPNGIIGHQGMQLVTLQDKNRALVLSSPYANLGDFGGRTRPAEITSLQTTIGLFNFTANPNWEIFVDGKKVEKLPFKAKYGAKITLHDGVSYLAMIPLGGGDLARDTDIEITDDGVLTDAQGAKVREAIRINAYIYKNGEPLKTDAPAVDLAWGGYAVEAGDAKEYANFAAFQKHIDATKLDTKWDAASKQLDVSFATGKDVLHCVYQTDYDGGTPTTKGLPIREVNGQWPYNAEGLERDSTLTQQGTTGKLAKNGATLTSEPGKMAYLLTEPKSGTFMGLNPFSEPTFWSMKTPEGVEIKADGRLGMARVIARPKENKVWVDYDTSLPARGDLATNLLIFGAKSAPVVELNGKTVVASEQKVDGQSAWAIALDGKPTPQLAARYAQAQTAATSYLSGKFTLNAIQDWQLVGPFALDFDKSFAPETDYLAGKLDLNATYKGRDGADVKWQRVNQGKAPSGEQIDLNSRFQPNQNVNIYGFTKIVSDRERDAVLLTGSDDGIKVWLNGKVVQSQDVYRGAAIDSERAPIRLQKGENSLLVKITQGEGGWGFFVRVADEFGVPLEGVSYPEP